MCGMASASRTISTGAASPASSIRPAKGATTAGAAIQRIALARGHRSLPSILPSTPAAAEDGAVDGVVGDEGERAAAGFVETDEAKAAVCKAADLIVPIKAKSAIGQNWGALEK